MENILVFLEELSKHNNREWFEANKSEYKAAQAKFNDFTEKLIHGIAEFDPSIGGISVRDCIYRIYRDTRFSKNKTPYKTHIGAYICKGGKNSGYTGYYFHIEPKEEGFIGDCLLAAGVYCPIPNVLKSIREEIFDNGADFIKTLKKAKGFQLEENNKLKRPPKGFPDNPYMEYLKLKDFTIMQAFDPKLLASEEKLLSYCLAEFCKTKDFNALLNRAVEFSMEEL